MCLYFLLQLGWGQSISTGEEQVRSICGGGRVSDFPPVRGTAAPVELVLILFKALVSSELEVGSMSETGFVFLLAEEGLALTSSAPPAVWLPRRPLLFDAAPRVLLLPLPLLSEELLLSFNGVLLPGRILLPRPRPARISTSLVGESQNLKPVKRNPEGEEAAKGGVMVLVLHVLQVLKSKYKLKLSRVVKVSNKVWQQSNKLPLQRW